MQAHTRRDFLKKAAVGAATLGYAGSAKAVGANEKVVVGLIGCGGRGQTVAQQMGGVAYVCDPDEHRLAATARRLGVDSSKAVTDLRRILDDDAVDAVIIATPDHWHTPAALLACEAGKHVYVEKPSSHNFRESRLLVNAARRYDRVVQHGTQSRSSELVVGAVQMLRDGIIGDVLVAKAWNVQRRRNIGHHRPTDPPPGVDYDTWVGPAEFVPYQENRFHYSWHWWYNFGTGDVGNDGVHEIDYALWGLGVETLPSKVSGSGTKLFFDDDQEFPDTATLTFDYPADGKIGSKRQLIFEMRIWSPNSPYDTDNGVEFYGTGGKMFLSKQGRLEILDDDNRTIEAKPESQPDLLSHQDDFTDAIRTGRRPNADIEIGHLAVGVVHLGNIVCRLGRPVDFDPVAERIVADPAANRLLRRKYRKGGHWAVPKGV
ncbi:MAG: Gfo/Idh/MocA family oxidoreductase [Armatimonadota bacterium]